MDEGLCAIMIPIIAIVGGITAGIFSMYFKYRSRQRLFDERQKLIEFMHETGELDLEKLKQFQDPEILEGVLGKDEARGDTTGNLKAGIILLAITLAFWALLRFYVVDTGESSGIQVIALFPGFLGVAFLIIHVICKPKRRNNHKDNSDNKKYQ